MADSPIHMTHVLKGTNFPARRADLVQQARHNRAEKAVVAQIEAMPDQEYHTMADVMKGFGASH